jgi:hypothetical protein
MKTRIKFHSFPGDVPKTDKIEMLENNHSSRSKSYKKKIRQSVL